MAQLIGWSRIEPDYLAPKCSHPSLLLIIHMDVLVFLATVIAKPNAHCFQNNPSTPTVIKQ
jgi:hypothetical protein